jgi:cobyrinic acid a,c-diamide synthase
MTITRKDVAEKISAYLRHQITLAELVDWAELAMMEADFEEGDFETIRNVLSRLGVADVRAFGLLWEDCEALLRRVGYNVHLEIVAA